MDGPLWGISASVNNYFGFFQTHSFTNSTFMRDPNSLVSGDDSFVHSQYGRPVVLKFKITFNKSVPKEEPSLKVSFFRHNYNKSNEKAL